LKDSPSTNQFDYNVLTSGGVERRYLLRLPENYDPNQPYRLILGFHGATNNAGDVAGNPAYFGLYDLAGGSTVFVAPEAVDGLWSADADVVFVDDILEQVEADLCIDTQRVIIQGFSQGAAMVRTLACARPSVFRAAVGHSAGGLPVPASCDPIPYFGSLGLQESGGGGQMGQTDFFATPAGCTIETLPTAPSGGHMCSDYQGCSDGYPVRWCSFDGPHTPLPNDAGQNSSWMPEDVWAFLSQF
jgi:pimeloyl-ACP methyl ester carboxylesterase